MRDTTLLNDILLYLTNEPAPNGYGRFQKRLVQRILHEMSLDSQEVYKLCSTFLRLFSDPQSDCQPSKPWEVLANKIRAAIHKKIPEHVETDPYVKALHAYLVMISKKKEFLGERFYPFRIQDFPKKRLKFSLKKN